MIFMFIRFDLTFIYLYSNSIAKNNKNHILFVKKMSKYTLERPCNKKRADPSLATKGRGMDPAGFSALKKLCAVLCVRKAYLFF